MKKLLIAGALVLIGIAGYYGLVRSNSGASEMASLKFGRVERGNLTATVSATGTLNPVVSVQVGSQVSGQLREILVDFNSPVKAGQIIARLDPQTLQQKVRQAEADLEATQASVAVQRAEVARAQAQLSEAQRNLERKKSLLEKDFISSAERDTALSSYEAALAGFNVARAQADNSAAQVKQRQAQLAQARVDLDRTIIRSPVDGVVVKRSMEPGQTVAASLQAPELFVIAQNLTDMQVETSIDEADVGRIQPGQKASFTVDAFPGKRFEGEVRQVRKAATIVSNVVSYTVVISAANPDLILLPGMTANVRIITAQKENVLKVPNAALRYRPTLPAGKETKNDKQGDKPSAVPQPLTFAKGKGDGRSAGQRVWLAGSDGVPRELPVKTGISDGSMSELLEAELKEGDEVITGQANNGNKPAGSAMPRLF